MDNQQLFRLDEKLRQILEKSNPKIVRATRNYQPNEIIEGNFKCVNEVIAGQDVVLVDNLAIGTTSTETASNSISRRFSRHTKPNIKSFGKKVDTSNYACLYKIENKDSEDKIRSTEYWVCGDTFDVLMAEVKPTYEYVIPELEDSLVGHYLVAWAYNLYDTENENILENTIAVSNTFNNFSPVFPPNLDSASGLLALLGNSGGRHRIRIPRPRGFDVTPFFTGRYIVNDIEAMPFGFSSSEFEGFVSGPTNNRWNYIYNEDTISRVHYHVYGTRDFGSGNVNGLGLFEDTGFFGVSQIEFEAWTDATMPAFIREKGFSKADLVRTFNSLGRIYVRVYDFPVSSFGFVYATIPWDQAPGKAYPKPFIAGSRTGPNGTDIWLPGLLLDNQPDTIVYNSRDYYDVTPTSPVKVQVENFHEVYLSCNGTTPFFLLQEKNTRNLIQPPSIGLEETFFYQEFSYFKIENGQRNVKTGKLDVSSLGFAQVNNSNITSAYQHNSDDYKWPLQSSKYGADLGLLNYNVWRNYFNGIISATDLQSFDFNKNKTRNFALFKGLAGQGLTGFRGFSLFGDNFLIRFEGASYLTLYDFILTDTEEISSETVSSLVYSYTVDINPELQLPDFWFNVDPNYYTYEDTVVGYLSFKPKKPASVISKQDKLKILDIIPLIDSRKFNF